jgi:endonuclease YncB( thermonuclease family)
MAASGQSRGRWFPAGRTGLPDCPMKSIYSILFLASLASTLIAAAPPASDKPPPPTSRVVSVYDGDTITLETGDRVRLRWVNTPELRPEQAYGIDAREAAKALVLGKEVELIYGPVKRDGYGRLLAGVRTEGTDLSEHLLGLGFAHMFIIPPAAGDHSARLAAQSRARKARRGIWSTDSYQGVLHITSFHANAPGDDRDNVNGEYARVCNITDHPVDLDGFRVTELSGRSWLLPPLLIPPGHTVKIHSGKGEHQGDPANQLAVYLGSDAPIWNNNRDRLTIYDRYGRVVDSRLHAPKSRQ